MSLSHEAPGPKSRLDSQTFWVLRRPGDSEAAWGQKVAEFVGCVCNCVRRRDGSVDWSLMDGEDDSMGRANAFLLSVLNSICARARELTAVVEPDHVDDVFRDMAFGRHVPDFFETSAWCLRLSLFSRELDAPTFLASSGIVEDWERGWVLPDRRTASGLDLQQCFVGCVVVIPMSGATVGRTLINPRWLLAEAASVRVSDYDVTVRGKRLRVSAWPWRAQDGEVLSCAETSLLGLSCYFSNQYREYPYSLPTDLLTRLEDPEDGTPRASQGLDLEQMGRVVTSMGLKARTYGVDTLPPGRVPGDPRSRSGELRRVARAYVDSGLPVVAMVQPSEGKVGHAVTMIGLSDDWRKASDADWARYAERMRGGGKHIALMDASDYERERAFVVSDDASGPYELRAWPYVSVFSDLAVTSLLVPTARQVRLGALDAHVLAMDVLRSPKLGLLAVAPDAFENEARLVVQQRLVSVSSYVKFRVQTCDEALSSLWEGCTWPGYLWLIEVLEEGQARQPGWPRKAVAEVVFDACTRGHDQMTAGMVLLRYPRFAHYHAPDGSSVTLQEGVGREFYAFDRSHRHVEPVAKNTSL